MQVSKGINKIEGIQNSIKRLQYKNILIKNNGQEDI